MATEYEWSAGGVYNHQNGHMSEQVTGRVNAGGSRRYYKRGVTGVVAAEWSA